MDDANLIMKSMRARSNPFRAEKVDLLSMDIAGCWREIKREYRCFSKSACSSEGRIYEGQSCRRNIGRNLPDGIMI